MIFEADNCTETVIGSGVGDSEAAHAGMSDAIRFSSSCCSVLMMNVLAISD